MIVPIDVVDLTETNLGDVFARPGEATFMYTPHGELVHKDPHGETLRAYPAHKITNAMTDDVEQERNMWGEEYGVVSIFDTVVLAWV